MGNTKQSSTRSDSRFRALDCASPTAPSAVANPGQREHVLQLRPASPSHNPLLCTPLSENRPFKICLLSVAASGKSTFKSKHPSYRGCRVVDVAELLPMPNPFVKALLYLGRVIPPLKKLAARAPSQQAKAPERYFSILKHYLDEQTEDTVLLANRGPQPPSFFEGITLAVVLIPEEEHRRHCESRKTGMRNPLPFLHHASTEFANVLKMRENLSSYATMHALRLFGSYEEAIESVLSHNKTVTTTSPQSP